MPNQGTNDPGRPARRAAQSGLLMCLAILLYNFRLAGATTFSFSILECGSSTCSPEQCVKNSDPDCEFNTNVPDFAAEVASLGCKACSQSTSGQCTALGETFRVADGHVKAAWCNDKYLVVASESLPAHDAGEALNGIPLPPGGDGGCRVRTAAAQLDVFKVPLNPRTATSTHNAPTPVPNVPGMPEAGATAVAIDGVAIFPNYNNRGMYAWESCELDRCNAHSGKGEDYHYHGDPFGAGCMYSEADYSGTHPPLIGFALDGFSIYGRYTGEEQDGHAVALDSCGAHTHDGMEYHYHPQVEEVETTDLDGTVLTGSITYTAYKGAPMECWGGDIDSIDNFYTSDGHQANYDSTKSGLCARNDLEDLRPCCGMDHYYASSGVTIVTSPAEGLAEFPACSSSSPPDASGILGMCEGTADDGAACPPEYSEDRPCPPGCTTVPAAPSSENDEGTSGTCEGTDDKGKACPASYDASRPCPPGCVSIPSGASPDSTEAPAAGGTSTSFSWTTANSAEYMCGSVEDDSEGLICAQGQYPEGTNFGGAAEAVLACPDGEVISCFTFASYGKVGGSCEGDPFMEDPAGEWEYLPVAVANTCLGQQSCTITAESGALSGVATPNAEGLAQAKFKALAKCVQTLAGGDSGGDTDLPPPPMSQSPNAPPDHAPPPPSQPVPNPPPPSPSQPVPNPPPPSPSQTPSPSAPPFPSQTPSPSASPSPPPPSQTPSPSTPSSPPPPSQPPSPSTPPSPLPSPPPAAPQDLPKEAAVVIAKLTFSDLEAAEVTDAMKSGIANNVARAAGVPAQWVRVTTVEDGSAVVTVEVVFDVADVADRANFEALVRADAPAIFADDPDFANLAIEKQGVVASSTGPDNLQNLDSDSSQPAVSERLGSRLLVAAAAAFIVIAIA